MIEIIAIFRNDSKLIEVLIYRHLRKARSRYPEQLPVSKLLSDGTIPEKDNCEEIYCIQDILTRFPRVDFLQSSFVAHENLNTLLLLEFHLKSRIKASSNVILPSLYIIDQDQAIYLTNRSA